MHSIFLFSRLSRSLGVLALSMHTGVALSFPSNAGEAACSNAETAATGCMAYEHRDFDGRRQDLGRNRHFSYVGDRMNDKISSFRVSRGCHVVVWEHRNKGGVSTGFDECQYIGDDWNDSISSWSCICR